MKSFLLSECESASSEMQNICEMNIRDCASKFNSYSTAELRNISKQMLHSLLSSSLPLDSQDLPWRELIDLGSDCFEYWNYLEIVRFSSEGISKFVETLPFEEVQTSCWAKIVDRLVGVCDETFRLRRFCKFQRLRESKFKSISLKILSFIDFQYLFFFILFFLLNRF
jgi:hypothetical protein